MVNAYVAGLGYRKSTKGRGKKKKRVVVPRADPSINHGDGGSVGSVGSGRTGSGGGSVDDGDDDNASEATTCSGTVTSLASSSSSRSNPAKDWWTDGGASNRWAMGPTVRKALFLSLQAGAMAHMSLKERRVAEVPWLKVGAQTTLSDNGQTRLFDSGRNKCNKFRAFLSFLSFLWHHPVYSEGQQ